MGQSVLHNKSLEGCLRVLFRSLLLCLLLWPVSFQARAAITVTDDAGRSVTLAQPAKRIVSLAPHATELLFAVGAGGQVVGVDQNSNYPPAVSAITSLGSALQLDLERLLALKPDLVVAWDTGNSRALLDKLESLGLTLFRSDPHRLEDIATNLERLGRLAGTEVQARQAALSFRQQVRQLRQRNSGKAKVRVFY